MINSCENTDSVSVRHQADVFPNGTALCDSSQSLLTHRAVELWAEGSLMEQLSANALWYHLCGET